MEIASGLTGTVRKKDADRVLVHSSRSRLDLVHQGLERGQALL